MPNIVPSPLRPDRQPGDPWTASTLAQEVQWLEYHDEWWTQLLHERVVELEHALISRKARRALRRKIRRETEQFSWAGPTFGGKRLEAAGNEYMTRLNHTREDAA